MKETTLCYLEQDGCYLMLYRNKKEKDPSRGKWIGVGGKLNPGETPEMCLLREVWEETGLHLTEYQKRGTILFQSDIWEDEVMHLYSATGFQGEMVQDCPEGELRWISKEEIMDLNLWEGDRLFLRDMIEGKQNIQMTLTYRGDDLVACTSTAAD